MILINGNFLCRNLTGIERFSFEILKCLDTLCKPEQLGIFVPCNASIIPQYKNIKIFLSDKPLTSFPQWDIFTFKKACKKYSAKGLSFTNTAPLGKNTGFAFIHDIYAKDFPQDFKSLKDRLIRFYSCWHYRNIARNAEKIFTVSEFSKQQIIKAYKTPAEKIQVIPNGWEHFSQIEEDNSIFEKFPHLAKGSYFFTLGSLQKRKNLAWIARYAALHPEHHFAISGKAISGMVSSDLADLQKLNNVTLLGYVSDQQVKSLMKNCRAFILTSYYEGFGIPPLEALSTGAKIIVSKAASLPEIYKDAAYYIDPDNSDCNLDQILAQPVADGTEILKEYTYMNAATKLYQALTAPDN